MRVGNVCLNVGPIRDKYFLTGWNGPTLAPWSRVTRRPCSLCFSVEWQSECSYEVRGSSTRNHSAACSVQLWTDEKLSNIERRVMKLSLQLTGLNKINKL